MAEVGSGKHGVLGKENYGFSRFMLQATFSWLLQRWRTHLCTQISNSLCPPSTFLDTCSEFYIVLFMLRPLFCVCVKVTRRRGWCPSEQCMKSHRWKLRTSASKWGTPPLRRLWKASSAQLAPWALRLSTSKYQFCTWCTSNLILLSYREAQIKCFSAVKESQQVLGWTRVRVPDGEKQAGEFKSSSELFSSGNSTAHSLLWGEKLLKTYEEKLLT